MNHLMLNRNQSPYLYECQFPTASYCCPCIYYIHETPDMSLDFNPNNISQPLLIPKKEKAIFNNYKEDTKNLTKTLCIGKVQSGKTGFFKPGDQTEDCLGKYHSCLLTLPALPCTAAEG